MIGPEAANDWEYSASSYLLGRIFTDSCFDLGAFFLCLDATIVVAGDVAIARFWNEYALIEVEQADKDVAHLRRVKMVEHFVEQFLVLVNVDKHLMRMRRD